MDNDERIAYEIRLIQAIASAANIDVTAGIQGYLATVI